MRGTVAIGILPSTVCMYTLATAAGIALGALYNLVTRHVELAILFPALAGLLAGAVVALAARAVRPGTLRTVALAAALAGGLAYASSFYFDYQEFRADLGRVSHSGATLPASQVDRAEAQLLGSPGVLSYLHARANYGIGTASTPVRGDVEWLVWIGEIVLAGMVASTVAQRTTAAGPQPSCVARRER